MLTAFGVLAPAAAATFFGPSPYLQAGDSPFASGTFNYFNLENFEDATLTPGFSVSGSWVRLGPSALTDSVDADDSVVDGSGTGGSSLFSNGANSVLEISFDAAVLGALPTDVGIVWTDVGQSSPTAGVGAVSFEAFDAANVSLGVIGPDILGDGSATGATAEDRFFGASNSTGILRVVMSMPQSTDWEVDHLQYGKSLISVPEPGSTLAYMLLAMAALCSCKAQWSRFF